MSKADALLPVLKIDLNSLTTSREGVRSAPFAHMSTASQQLTTVRPSSADCCFLVASGGGANGTRSTSWIFFKTFKQKLAGGAEQARDASWWFQGPRHRIGPSPPPLNPETP